MGLPPQTIQELFGRHMVAARALAGLSQKAMADRLHVQQPYVTQLERGQWSNIDPLKLLEYVRIGLDVNRIMQEWLALAPSERRAASRVKPGRSAPLAGDVFTMVSTPG